jgi:hypothetical protein
MRSSARDKHQGDLSCHGAWGHPSPDFPPLNFDGSTSPVETEPITSIDLSQPLPCFSYPAGEEGQTPQTSHMTLDTNSGDAPVQPSPAQAEGGVIGRPKAVHADNPALERFPGDSNTPFVQPVTSTFTQPIAGFSEEPNYDPIGDISMQMPSFTYAASGKDFTAFPTLPPGPLPAPCKAPVSAWSKPLAARLAPQRQSPPARSAPNDRLSFSTADEFSDTKSSVSASSSSPHTRSLSPAPTQITTSSAGSSSFDTNGSGSASSMSSVSIRTPSSSIVVPPRPRQTWNKRGASPIPTEYDERHTHTHTEEDSDWVPKSRRSTFARQNSDDKDNSSNRNRDRTTLASIAKRGKSGKAKSDSNNSSTSNKHNHTRDHELVKKLAVPALQPRFDDDDWLTITEPAPAKRSMGGRSTPRSTASSAAEAKWASWGETGIPEVGERREITGACLAAGEEDPYGGWLCQWPSWKAHISRIA